MFHNDESVSYGKNHEEGRNAYKLRVYTGELQMNRVTREHRRSRKYNCK